MMSIQIIFGYFGELDEPGQQEPTATDRAKHKARSARSAAQPKTGATDTAAEPKA